MCIRDRSTAYPNCSQFWFVLLEIRLWPPFFPTCELHTAIRHEQLFLNLVHAITFNDTDISKRTFLHNGQHVVGQRSRTHVGRWNVIIASRNAPWTPKHAPQVSKRYYNESKHASDAKTMFDSKNHFYGFILNCKHLHAATKLSWLYVFSALKVLHPT